MVLVKATRLKRGGLRGQQTPGRTSAGMIANSSCLRQSNPCVYSASWKSWTKVRKRCVTSNGLRIPGRSTTRNLSHLKISSASSARPKSKSGYASQAASSRSSSPEKFDSRFFARATFFAVSVTVNIALPSDFRPAPSRFPPHLTVFFMKIWHTKDSPRKSRL